MTRIIAISGKAASGKDTTAFAIKDQITEEGGNAHIVPFADDLKKVTSHLWDIDPEYLKTYAGKAKLRSKLIQLGGFVRDIDPNTWVNLVAKKIKNVHETVAVCIIPDLRFLNELYRLIAEFGRDVLLVRVTAPAHVRMERMGRERAREYVELGICSDISETQFDFLEKPAVWFDQETLPAVQELQSYARTIDNSGSFEDLERAVGGWAANDSAFPTQERAEAAMKAAYMLAKRLGPEAKLVLGL